MGGSPVYITVLGWFLVYYLHSRTLHRGEIARIKDNLVSKINSLQDLIESQLGKKDLDPILMEQICTGRCTQIALYIKQLNQRVGYELISNNNLQEIMKANFRNLSKDDIVDVLAPFYDFVEEIEDAYLTSFLKRSAREKLWLLYKYEILGAIFGGTMLLIFLYLAKFIIETIYRM